MYALRVRPLALSLENKMLSFKTQKLLALLALTAVGTTAQAAAINVVAYNSVGAAQTLTFEGNAGGVLDGVQTIGAAKFGERFAGQTLGANADFDTLSGTPTKPLTLLSGAAGQNLLYAPFGSMTLIGLGNAGLDDEGNPFPNAVGEGAVSVLFDGDQSQIGFKVVGANPGGTLLIDFFRFDGSLIETLSLADLSGGSFGFQRDGDVKDIAGMSIRNNDFGGLAFDDFVFNVVDARDPGDPGTVPEPTALLLAGLGLLAAGTARRRKA